MLKKIILCLSVIFFGQGILHLDESKAQKLDKHAAMLMQEIVQIQHLSYGDIKIALTDEDRKSFQDTLQTDTIVYNANPIGSHLFGLVILEAEKSLITIGISGENQPVLTVRKNEDEFYAFNITIKNLSATNKAATQIANTAFKNGTTNIDTLLQSFTVKMQKNVPSGGTISLSAQEKAALPTLLLTKEWRLTSKYDHSKNSTLGPVFLMAPNDYMKVLSFKSSNQRYYVDFTFDDDFSHIQIEVPKKALENLGILPVPK